jgi:hypothetical protein
LIPADKGKLVLHADGARCDTAKAVPDFVSQRKIRFAPHPPYFPDMALSNFFLFGSVKRELRGSLFQTAEEHLAEVQKLMDEISPATLLNVLTAGLEGAKV